MTTARALRGPFDYRLPVELRQAVAVGSMLVVPFGRREVLGVVTHLSDRSDVPASRLLEPVRVLEAGVPGDLVELAEWIAAEYCSTIPRALKLVIPPSLTRGQLSGRPRRTKARRPEHVNVGALRGSPPDLTGAQRAVLAELIEAMGARRVPAGDRMAAGDRTPAGAEAPVLLHGVTGSGKTEIYLRIAAVVLERGQGAIILVPEIALTPQIVSRFLERFGEMVAVLHSQLRPSERREEWRRLRSGEARICVGPRSAVFAPIESLGLIVVDEEHDASYKHEGDPRYDARDVAARRAMRTGALLLAGSATPRVESVERTRVLRLAERVDRRPLPNVEILDMRGQRGGLHPASVEALSQLRRRQGKGIVLLNRRGWSNFLSCRACGTVWSCPDCDVALVMHRAEETLTCHHCGHCEPIPRRCECGSTTLARHGLGTERLEHDLSAALDDGEFPVFRLDADTAGGGSGASREGVKGAGGSVEDAANRGVRGAAELLSRFEQAPSGVLIGTQMVAKGHDFPDVTLGIVLDADGTLRFPDFRAEERTFALIAQLAGRVGRGTEGRVLVQTIDPGARSIVQASRHDSDAFVSGELERRKALRYPPFSHLIRVVCAAESTEQALSAARELAQRLAPLRDQGASVLGPASLFRLRGRERQAIVVKANHRSVAVSAVDAAVQAIAAQRRHSAVSIAVDVDPQ